MKSLLVRARKEKWGYAYAFIAPIVILFGLFRVYPSIETLIFSFFDVNIISKTYTPVGLANFARLLDDSSFMLAMKNTLLYAVYIVVVSTVIGMVLASIFNSKMKGAGVFKAVYFAPFITSTVAAAVVWGYLYDPKFGLFNMILRLLSLPPRGWIASSEDALMSIIIFSIWKTVGYNMVLFIAGLQNISKDFYEAATIDGAGPITKFFRITVPLLAPTTIFVVMYNTILSLKVFDQVFVLTSGGPADASTVIVLQIYKQAFENYQFGYAAAMAFILFIIIIILTILQFKASKKWEVTL